MSVAGLDKDLKNALTEGANNLENIGSQTSLNKVSYHIYRSQTNTHSF